MFGLHYQLERKAVSFVLAIIGVASIGGFVEIAPLSTIHQTVEDVYPSIFCLMVFPITWVCTDMRAELKSSDA